jgi:hypothetical protein
MPPSAYQEYSVAVIVLACTAISVLLIITILLFRIHGRLAALSSNLSRQDRPAKTEAADSVEIGSGTHFELFLKEDPARLSLPKKEQFKAYRQWRSERGLNWAAKD